MPIKVVYNLMEGIVGNVRTLLVVMGALAIVVASIGVLVSIYNSMNDRRRELAIMRSLGAGRRTVFVIVLMESLLLSLGGGVLGLALGHGTVGVLSPIIASETGALVGPWDFPMTCTSQCRHGFNTTCR
jgi:putative ABC transport system permease protein